MSLHCLVCGCAVDVVTRVAEGDIICPRCRQRLWTKVTEFISKRWNIPQQEITRATWLENPMPRAADLGELIAYCFPSIKGFDSLDVVEAVLELEEELEVSGFTDGQLATAGGAYLLMLRMLRMVARQRE